MLRERPVCRNVCPAWRCFDWVSAGFCKTSSSTRGLIMLMKSWRGHSNSMVYLYSRAVPAGSFGGTPRSLIEIPYGKQLVRRVNKLKGIQRAQELVGAWGEGQTLLPIAIWAFASLVIRRATRNPRFARTASTFFAKSITSFLPTGFSNPCTRKIRHRVPS